MGRMTLTRRRFLRMGVGAAGGLALGGGALGRLGKETAAPGTQAARTGPYFEPAGPATVSVIKGDNRYRIVTESLEAIGDDILRSIGDKTILLKPNVALADNLLADTHVDCVRAILDFLAPHYKKTIIVGEGAHHRTFDAYKACGYLELEKTHHVRLVDLNQDRFERRYVFGAEHRPLAVRISSTCLDPNVYIISAARMKTHNYVLVTLSLKNLLLGCPIKDDTSNDKALFHTGPEAVNDICHFNMFHIAQDVFPDLAVIDGFEAMEGNGPAWGTPFKSRVALASLDPVAADTVATRIMGFDPGRVLYLSSMAAAGLGQGDLQKMRIVGAPLDQCLYKFKAHKKMAELYKLT
ncbi:MAG: hypothetical protein A2W03_09615 [Candidatus Aminicenantes bacterium RBG_16_63_16]|nr:MAG: hypothetical protein A2W03_09615 [Candidatus Aminicenantes bacterium RBG_16_63_16]